MTKAFVLLLAALAALACVATARAADPAPLILVSLDGVHPDFLKLGRTPALNRLAKRGVRARWMTPSYPTLTFPNHWTLVTGLRPDRHGVVANNMRDPTLGDFSRHDPQAVGEPRWFGGEPIWATAAKHGYTTATMFWPGSEAPVGGAHPTHWRPFDYGVGPTARVDQVLAWLDLPAAQRPRFVTLYFEHADRAGHDYGPGSPELLAALSMLDAQVSRLLRGLQQRRLAANVVVVSDHGMAAVSRERLVLVDDYLDAATFNPTNMGEVLMFHPRAGHEAALEKALLAPRDHVDCFRRADAPPAWRFGTHARIPPVVCQVEAGWRFVTRKWLNERRGNPGAGAHGYAPEEPSMRAIFIAAGPDIAQAGVVEPFDNVHVQPFLCALLRLECPTSDGDAAVTRELLAKP